MSWKGLRRKGTEVLTSREWNLSVEALDELYGMLTTGQQDIIVRDIYARIGNFSESVNTVAVNAGTGNFDEAVLVQGRSVIKDGDPVQIYQFYGIAVSQITRAIDEARVTSASELVREYTGRTATVLEEHQPKLDLIAEYTQQTRDVVVRVRMDEYGNVGVVIAEPVDEYGRISISPPSELLDEFKPVSAYGSITAADNTAGFEVVLEKRGRPNVNVFYSLGGAGELLIEVSRDGVSWRTLHRFTFTEATTDIIVDSGVAYPYIRARTPTTGIDVELEIIASR